MTGQSLREHVVVGWHASAEALAGSRASLGWLGHLLMRPSFLFSATAPSERNKRCRLLLREWHFSVRAALPDIFVSTRCFNMALRRRTPSFHFGTVAADIGTRQWLMCGRPRTAILLYRFGRPGVSPILPLRDNCCCVDTVPSPFAFCVSIARSRGS